MTFTRHARRTASALALVLVMLTGAACGSSSSTSSSSGGGSGGGDLPPCPIEALDDATGPVEVVVWHSYVAKTKETLEKLAAQYNDSQDKVSVRVESQGNSYDELWSKYQQSAQSGGLPAIAILEDTATRSIVDSGTVLPGQSCIDADNYDTSDLVQTGIDYYSVDDAFYPASINMSSPLLYFNKNHFRRANLDPSAPPTTLDEVRQVAQEIKDAGVATKPLVMNMSSWYIETWLTGDGKPMVDNDNGRGDGETTTAAFDNPDTVALMQWLKDMYDDGLLNAIPYTPGKIDHLLAMSEQSASMVFETSTAATSIKAFLAGDRSIVADASAEDAQAAANVDTSGLDIDAAKIPGLTEAGQVQMSGGAWYMTNSTAPEVQAAAWDFMKWWNSPATQTIWNTEGSYIPFSTTAAQSPEVQQFWRNDIAGRWLSVSYEQLSEGVDPSWPGPLIGPYDETRDSIESNLDELVLQGKEPQAAVTSAADATTSAIERYNQGNF
jgi:sn-glycerol 3-phosphate transport system substrate-binding protein